MIAQALDRERSQRTYRTLDSTRLPVDFSSNDYLGLAHDDRIRARLMEALAQGCPLGSTGSRLLTGQTPYHERVEDYLAAAFRAESVLLFSSGYLANLGVMTALGSLESVRFFSDANNHASLIDGMRLAKAARTVFRHNDANDLEAQLTRSDARQKIIVTESIFSMDGDCAPLGDYMMLAERFAALLVVDEAHATGVTGSRGLGCLDGVRAPRVIAIHTGGKALGGQGAFVTSDRQIRELLINRARSFIYTTALAPLAALQLQLAVETVMADDVPRLRLAEHVRVLNGTSQIVPVIRGATVLEVLGKLRSAGFDVRAIRYPTVPAGTERLRIALKSFHTAEQVQALAALL